jgi:hypothetical protein
MLLLTLEPRSVMSRQAVAKELAAVAKMLTSGSREYSPGITRSYLEEARRFASPAISPLVKRIESAIKRGHSAPSDPDDVAKEIGNAVESVRELREVIGTLEYRLSEAEDYVVRVARGEL